MSGNRHQRRGDELSAAEVYAIWKIRDAVFAFEQQVADVDVDDLDLRADTIHVWLSDANGPTSYLRILTETDSLRIGRVCTRKDMRGRGLSSELMRQVAAQFGQHTLTLHAQAYLEEWYAQLGYLRSGENFTEAGIEHVPMSRPATPPAAGR